MVLHGAPGVKRRTGTAAPGAQSAGMGLYRAPAAWHSPRRVPAAWQGPAPVSRLRPVI
jgi:hypothetical protein